MAIEKLRKARDEALEACGKASDKTVDAYWKARLVYWAAEYDLIKQEEAEGREGCLGIS